MDVNALAKTKDGHHRLLTKKKKKQTRKKESQSSRGCYLYDSELLE